MDATQALILGVVQGISEFLPISSTAHLILVPWFMRWPDPGLTFDVALHVGTFIAVATYFWRDLQEMLLAWFKSLRAPDLRHDPQQRLAWLVLFGCIPAGIAGITLEHLIETTLRSPWVIATTLIGVAGLLALAEVVGRRYKDLKNLTLFETLAIGLAQACALIPGTSRSGATMTMAMFLGLRREAAARFSFLLGVPIIFASCLFKFRSYFKGFGEAHPGLHGQTLLTGFADHVATSPNLVPFIVGVVASTVVGYLSIRLLMAFLQRRSMWVFVGYRVVLGLIIVVLLLTHQLPSQMNLG